MTATLAACEDTESPTSFGRNGSSSGDVVVDQDGGSCSRERPQSSADYQVKDDVVTTSDGTTHRFTVVEPRRGQDRSPLPVIVAYHGNNETRAMMQSQWRIEQYVNKGALVIYPDGNNDQCGASWGGEGLSAKSSYADAFAKIIDRAKQVYRADTSRVFLAGMSRGAIFATLLACRYSAPGAFTLGAVAVMSGSLTNQPLGVDGTWEGNDYYFKCNGQQPLPTFVVHGTADEVIALQYGRDVADYATFVNRVAQSLGGQQGYGLDAPTAAVTGLPSECRRYTEAPDNAPVVMCTVPAMEHQLWSESARAYWQFASFAPPR